MQRVIKYLCLIGLVLSTPGCYEDFIVINSEPTRGIYNRSGTEIAFFHFLQIGRPPKGISRFPDGGTQEILFKQVTLCRYNIQTGKLNVLFNFGDLPSNYSFWRKKISWENDLIAFSIKPGVGWEEMIRISNSDKFIPYYKEYGGIFIYSIPGNKETRLTENGYQPCLSPGGKYVLYMQKDSVTTQLWIYDLKNKRDKLVRSFDNIGDYSLKTGWYADNIIGFSTGNGWSKLDIESQEPSEVPFDQVPDEQGINRGEIIDLTNHLSLSDWGVNLPEVWPVSRKEWIQDIVLLNGNLNYRKAILEEIGDDLSKAELEKILGKMEKYMSGLEGPEKMEYSIFSEETKALVTNLLEERDQKE